MKYCRYCGAEIKDDAIFCPECGKKVDETNDIVNSEDSNVSTKSRAVAAILAFLFGGFGAHRFYVGKKKSGAAFLAILIVANISFVIAVYKLVENSITTSTTTANTSTVAVTSSLVGAENAYLYIGIVLYLILYIAILVDFIVILIGKFKDNDDKTIKNW